MRTIRITVSVMILGILAPALYAGPADSLQQALQSATGDTARFHLLVELSRHYLADSAEHAEPFAREAIEAAERTGSRGMLGEAYAVLGAVLTRIGKLNAAHEAHEISIEHYTALGDSAAIVKNLWRLGRVESMQGRYASAVGHTLSVLKYYEHTGNRDGVVDAVLQLGRYHQQSKQTDRALEYLHRAEELIPPLPLTADHMRLYGTQGMCYQDMGDDRRAIKNFRKALEAKRVSGQKGYSGDYHRSIAASYLHLGVYDSAETYAQRALEISEELLLPQDIVASIIVLAQTRYAKQDYRDALSALSGALPLAKRIGANAQVHEALDLMARIHAALRNYRRAYEYSLEAADYRDTLYSAESIERLTRIEDRFAREKQRQREAALAAIQEEQLRNATLIRNAAIAGLVLVAIVAVALWNRFRLKQRTSEQIEKAYTDLKATQEQLLQSEQLASLGQLTAGIAHEIKNPLNFVNNFSGLSVELIEELEAILAKKEEEDPEAVAQILKDLKMNLTKIEEHGVRADRIVKTMMLHARKEGAEKHAVEINTLVGDSAELAWHSARAAGMEAQVQIEKRFADDTGEVMVLPQEMSRVVLNLIQNALHAVSQKAEESSEDYAAKITLETERTEDAVIIRCRDNGTGIPESAREKVFNPFFTTKPVGIGTGLGLSMAFDIVVKEHHGTMTFDSTEGEGTEFTVTLPVE